MAWTHPPRARLAVPPSRCTQPRAVSEADDKELQDLMNKAEQETTQVAGDEPEDDEGL